MPDSFSQRHGLAGPPVGTLYRAEVPVSFRRFLTTLPHAKVGIDIWELNSVVCDVFQEWPSGRQLIYEKHIRNCEWFYIYQIIEDLYKLLYQNSGFPRSTPYAFVTAINEALVKQNIGWKLVNGLVITRGDEISEKAIVTASSVLKDNRRPTAAGHIQSSMKALSERPKSNTPGAVSQATSAVECLLHDITGETMTLGRYLDKYPKLFHPALKKALDGLYGFASDAGARHGKEGIVPTFEEAQFVVTTCAAACTLLTAENPNQELEP